MMMKIALGFLAVAFLATAQADDSIQLPSGSVVKTASFEVHPNWKKYFPPDEPFFAEMDAEGKLQGMHRRYSARLDGASTVLHENGNLKILAFYPEGQRDGACRVWDEEQRMVLYSKYDGGKKNGITCLLKDGTPWLVQEWEKGTLRKETLLADKGGDFVAVDDAQQLAEAKKRLAAVENELTETDKDLKNNLRKWFAEEREITMKEKERAAEKLARAQRTRKQAAKSKGLATVASTAEAAASQAKLELDQIDKKRAEDRKQLYDLALAALEESLLR